MKVTLCGSTRFKTTFEEVQMQLGLAGHVVYGLNGFGRMPEDEGKNDLPTFSTEDKVKLDLIHLAKIEESDAVGILNVGGYIGESTHRELMWARLRGKQIYYLEADNVGGRIEHLLNGIAEWKPRTAVPHWRTKV